MNEAEQAFLEAYQEHADAIFRYCLFKVRDREMAKDLSQETFTKTWKYLTQGGEVLNFKAFFYHTAQNAVIDHYRKHKSESLDSLHEKGFDPGEDCTERLVDELDGAQVMEIMRGLPKEYHDVIFMRYAQELSNGEIAEMLGETETAVRVRVHRGLKKLREMLGDEW